MADKTDLQGEKLTAVRDMFTRVGLDGRKKTMDESPTKKSKYVHIGMYFFAPGLLLLFL